MGLFGGGGGTQLSKKAKGGGNAILGALMPGNDTYDKYAWGDMFGDTPYASILEGLPGVITTDSQGNVIQPGESSGLGTPLPSIASIADYGTLMEKFSDGQLDPTSQSMIENFMGFSTGGNDAILGLLGEVQAMSGGAGGGMGGGGGGGGISAPEFNAPPNIGELTTEIIGSLPPDFQDFIGNVLDAADPASFQSELQNFEDKMTAKMLSDISQTSGDLNDVFASQGLAHVSGAATKVVAEAATRAILESNAIIANERIKGLEIYTSRLQTGNQMMQILLSAGATEHANLVSGEIARMEAQVAGEVAALQAQTALQQTAMQTHTQQMGILAGAAVDMFGIQANMANSAFQGLLAENARAEADMNAGLMLPYDLLTSFNSQKVQKGQGFDIGSLIGGGLAVGASFL